MRTLLLNVSFPFPTHFSLISLSNNQALSFVEAEEKSEEKEKEKENNHMLHDQSCMELSDYSKEAPLPKIETTHLPKEPTNVSESSTEAVNAVESEAENLGEPGGSDASAAAVAAKEEEEAEECARERLKKHRMEMGGQVWIPEMWGQESLLKDWVDCAAFDSSLVPTGVVSAREALVSECRRRTNARPLQIQNRRHDGEQRPRIYTVKPSLKGRSE